MALSTSLQSYQDCLDFFEKVIDDPKGGRVCMGTWDRAHNFRMRCNYARKLHREENKRLHDPGTKMWGASEYDPLCLQIKIDTTGQHWVYAIKMQLDVSQIELLSEIDDTPLVEDQSPLAIEGPADAPPNS